MRSLILVMALAVPGVASADLLTFWAAGKADYVSGSGDVYQRFDQPFGYGAEVGVEVLFIDLWGDALILGDEQFLFTLNLGLDFSFGDDVRFTIGAFTGPMFFVFPEESAQHLMLDGASRDALITAGLSESQINKFEKAYNDNVETEEELSRLGLGWNVGRLRANLEFELAPVLYLGVDGMVGYHFILSGEDAAAGAKNGIVDDIVAENDDLGSSEAKIMRDAVGAKEVDPDSLDGVNFQAGVYLKLEL